MTLQARLSRAALSILAIWLAYQAAQELLIRFAEALSGPGRIPFSFLAFCLFGLAAEVVFLLALWAPGVFRPLQPLRQKMGWLRWVLAGIIASIPAYLFLFTKWSDVFPGNFERLLVYLACLGLIAWLVSTGSRPYTWSGLLTGLLLFGSVFTFAAAFGGVSSYPFSIGWSEGNRMWDYSTAFGQRLYDWPADQPIPSYTDQGRTSLWGLPFLVTDPSIWIVRFWSGLVFTLPYALLGWALFKPHKGQDGLWLLFGLWSFLFLSQGPIYTPLVLAAILVAVTRRLPWWAGMVLTAAAGYYAGFSRFTWAFAPGIWAGLAAFIEVLPPGMRTVRQRWLRTIALGFGGLFGGYLYNNILEFFQSLNQTAISGTGGGLNPPEAAGGIFDILTRQPLLWDRLWPNPTFALGIAPALLLAAGPAVGLILWFIFRRQATWQLADKPRQDRWQKLAVCVVLLAFLSVGLVISVKIGGGNNLHNLDMFLITVVLLAALAIEAGLLADLAQPGRRTLALAILLLLAVGYPAQQNMFSADAINVSADEFVEDALTLLQREVPLAAQNGEVLFIDQRQLLTFGMVPRVPLVAEYEKKILMDMAMAEDTTYFDPFYKDLAAHRFSLIITEPLRVHYQGGSYQFGNENDAWVRFVSVPLLCYYEATDTYQEVGMQVLRPKEKSSPSPDVTCPVY